MTESDARSVLLVRAFETVPNPVWDVADAARAGDSARRTHGEGASPENWIAARARSVASRLAARETGVAALLRASGWPAWLGWVAVLVAFGAGVASDAIGQAHRINILAPPLLALLAWNLAVYAALIVRAFAGPASRHEPGLFRRVMIAGIERSAAAVVRRVPRSGSGAALRAFALEWAAAGRPLYAARAAAILHAAAAALALGALVSLYARGLALEYLAGWESTFLTAADVHVVLARTLGPAAWLSGIPLPDTERLAALRFSAGPGENAAAWIHLYAISVALAVLLPRLLLSAAAALRARRLARRFPLHLDDAYFRRLQRDGSAAPVPALVLPYSYHLTDSQRSALKRALERHVAARIEPAFRETLALGAEDDVDRWIGGALGGGAQVVVALFALAATPEGEHHGAFVHALAARAGADRVFAVVDESGFRQRFSGADLSSRLEQRRHAWQSLLAEHGIAPIFVDLSDVAGSD